MSSIARIRLVAINDVYELKNLPKLQSFLSSLEPAASAVLLAGDFISPSPLSSIDGGRGMVDSLRATGITHFCFGNHEADLKLSTLKDRISELSKSATLINTNMRHPPPFASWLTSPLTPPWAIVSSPCQRVNVALLGLMSDEDSMFRDGTFKGVPVDNVLESFTSSYEALVPKLADMVVPMTHQSVARDRDLATRMLEMDVKQGIIIGGHEHDPIDETIQSENGSIRILKSGFNARQAALIDLDFDPQRQLQSLSASLFDLSTFEDSVVVKKIIDSHLALVEKMENEIIVDDSMVPPGIVLSSEGTMYSQTTVGAFFCHAIKEELEVDVAIMNGASIAGDTTYFDSCMSYADLKRELPFPTKMVVVPMTRVELQDAVDYSHTNLTEGDVDSLKKDDGTKEEIPRKGYLQVDFAYEADPYSGAQDDELLVALPRNLMGGFCGIQPLMDIGDRLKENNQFPSDDDFVPALDLVTRHCCKNRWASIGDSFNFDDIDFNHDGNLDRQEVKAMMEKVLGHEPEDFFVDDMIKSIDEDENGVVDMGELSHVLASMERNNWRKS